MDHAAGKKYLQFAAMIGTSMLAMYGITYLNSFDNSHVRWSETRFFMTLIMGSTMAVIMLGYMWGMYENVKVNAAIIAVSVLTFIAGLWLVRSQTTVQDSSYMRAMIPHHSIAILTSDRAEIDDLRVRKLADEISDAQRREIKEMNWLLEDIRENGKATSAAEVEARPLPEFEPRP